MAHAQEMAFNDVARGDELETAIDVRMELAVAVVAQGPAQARGKKSAPPITAQQVATITSCPPAAARQHSCSTSDLLRS